MNQEHQIDKIFSEAAHGFAPKAPAATWKKIDSSLAAARFMKRLWIGIAASVLLISTLGLVYLNTPSKPEINNYSHLLKPQNNQNTTSSSQNETINLDEIENSNGVENVELSTANKPQIQKVQAPVSNEIVAKSGENIQSKKVENVSVDKDLNAKIANKAEITGVASNSVANRTVQSNVKRDGEMEVTIQKLPLLPSTINQSNYLLVEKMDGIALNKLDFAQEQIFIPHYELSANMGFAISGSNYKYPEIDNPEIAVNESERSGNSGLMGLEVSYYFHPKWNFSFGAEIYNYNYHSNITLPDNPTFVNTQTFGYGALGYYGLSNIQKAMRTRNYAQINYLTQLQTIHSQLNAITFPMLIGYQMKSKKWMFTPEFGINYTWIYNNSIEIGDDYGYYLQGSINNINNQLWGISGGMDIAYCPSYRWRMGFRSRLHYSLTDVNREEDFKFHPGVVQSSVYAGMRF